MSAIVRVNEGGATVVVTGAALINESLADAETAATAAASSATAAATSATAAQTARTGAETARDVALAALGNSLIFATKAAADAALASVAADAYIMVLADETQAGRAWRYQKVSGAYVSRGAAVNLGPLVVPRGALSGGGAETSEPIRINAPTGSQVNGAGVNDAVTTGMVLTTGQFNSGTANRYFDTVLSIGHNMNGSITARFNAEQPISRIGIESKFQQALGQPFKSEYHLASLLYPTDAGGAASEYRAISAVIPHRQADWNTTAASVYFRGNVFAFAHGVDGLPVMSLEVANTRLRFTAGYSTLFETNNRPIALQHDAAGASALALPFVNNQNRYAFSLPVTGVPSAGSVTASGFRVFTRGWSSSTLQLDAPGSNASSITLSCGTTQAASGSIPVTCNGTTTIPFAANAIVEADVGRFITGTNVPADTRIIDISSTTTAVVSNACPGTVTSIIMSARTERAASYAIDDTGSVVLGTAPNDGAIMYVDTHGGVVWRDTSGGFATRMMLNPGATGGLQVNTRVGFNSVTPIARRTVAAAATDAATTQALVNELRQLLIDVGLAQ